MRKKLMLSYIILFFTFSTYAKNKIYCGKREGTTGNAFLVDKNGKEVIMLAMQGDDQTLLLQADTLVGEKSGVKGEKGTQNGKFYCVTAELDNEGEPIKIIKARLDKNKK